MTLSEKENDRSDSGTPRRSHHEVLIVGAGFAGIGAAIKLGEAGLDYLILEKADKLGGVWRDNVYPDCACDVPSSFYSYSFAPKPDWNHVFAHQAEIRDYAEQTAKEHGVVENIRFGCELFEARWNVEADRWDLETSAGSYSSRFVVMATGPMHIPVTPNVPGLESFPGEQFHSARWDDDIDLCGKHVAVIGTGASAIQFVPPIQSRVRQMTIFQRTAPWVLPKLDAPVSPLWQERFRRFPILQRLLRGFLFAQFEFLNWSLNHASLRGRLERAARRNIDKRIKDPDLRKRLTPTYAIGCKRILQSNKWYRALASDNVTVAGGVREIEGRTVVSVDGTRAEADVLIFATGFQVANPPIAECIIGASGERLADRWKGSPEAYLGTTVPDCPNCFLLLGPNLYAFSSAFVMIEAQLRYVMSALTKAKKKGVGVLSIREQRLAQFNRILQDSLQSTVFNRGGCTSYFIDRNGRNATNWPWTTLYLRRRLRSVDLRDYDVRSASAGEEA